MTTERADRTSAAAFVNKFAELVWFPWLYGGFQSFWNADLHHRCRSTHICGRWQPWGRAGARRAFGLEHNAKIYRCGRYVTGYPDELRFWRYSFAGVAAARIRGKPSLVAFNRSVLIRLILPPTRCSGPKDGDYAEVDTGLRRPRRQLCGAGLLSASNWQDSDFFDDPNRLRCLFPAN